MLRFSGRILFGRLPVVLRWELVLFAVFAAGGELVLRVLF